MANNTAIQVPNIPARAIYPVKEARAILGGIGVTKFYELVNTGKLSLVKQGTRSYAPAASLMGYLNSLGIHPNAALPASNSTSKADDDTGTASDG